MRTLTSEALLFIIIVLALVSASPGVAQENETQQPRGPEAPEAAERRKAEAEAEAETEETKPITITTGIDFVSQYISRGEVFSSRFSIQPWIEAEVMLAEPMENVAAIDRIAWIVGNWNSLQSGDPGVGQERTHGQGIRDHWYELDLYTGPRLTIAEHVEATLRFNWYTSPSKSFGDIYELDLRLNYDDAAFWEETLGWSGFTLAPELRIAKELRNVGESEQWYFRPLLTPTFSLNALPGEPKLMFPQSLGFGADGHYREISTGEEHHFGFFRTGVGMEIPIQLGRLDNEPLLISIGVDVYIVADEELSGTGDQVETVGTFGLSYSF